MKSILISILLLATVSCQTKEVADTGGVHVVVEEFLNLEKYDEAEQYIADKPMYRDAYWAAPTIKQSRICTNAINSCENEFTNLQSTVHCRREIEIACPMTRPPISDHAQKRKSATIEKTEMVEKSLLPFIIYEKQCEPGYKWGFLDTKTPKYCISCAWSLNIDLKKLTGEYNTMSECEEARILANEKSKTDLSRECHKRYLGEEKYAVLE